MIPRRHNLAPPHPAPFTPAPFTPSPATPPNTPLNLPLGTRRAEAARFDHYERFSRSHHWLPGAGREAAPAPAPPSAAFARACARAVTRYWEIGLATGNIDPAREVVVLELDAGAGHFTWQMLEALRESLADSLCAGLQMRYIACVPDSARADALARRLTGPAREIALETAVWRAGSDGPCPRLHGENIDLTGNPPAILAHRYFGGLVQDMFRRRHGRLFEGLLDQRSRAAPLAYRWRGIEAADWLPAPWRELLATRDDAAPALFPSGALHSLDRLAQLAQRRFLLLAVDQDGHGAAPPRAWPANRHLPVDLACLGAYQAGQGAQVWSGWRGADRLRTLAVLRDDANPARRETLDAVIAGLREAAPDDHLHLAAILRAAAHALEPARVLALVRLSGFEPGVLEAGLDALERDPAGWDEPTRQDARAILARVWANHLPRAGQGALGPRLAELAMALGYWGLAKSVLRMETASRVRPAHCLYRLAACEAGTGETREALAHVEEALRAAGAESVSCPAGDLRDRLAARLRAWADLPWYHPERAREGDLRIEPTTGGPGVLNLVHECWGRLGTLDARIADRVAHFRLRLAPEHVEAVDPSTLARLLASPARALGALALTIESAAVGIATPPMPLTGD